MTLIAGSVTTADTDGTRLITGTSATCGIACTVAAGPFVLTDALTVDANNFTWLVLVDGATDCSGLCGTSGYREPLSGMPVATLTAYRPNSSYSGPNIPDHLSGARFFVPAGMKLCACITPVTLPGHPWKAWWSGFVPYQ